MLKVRVLHGQPNLLNNWWIKITGETGVSDINIDEGGYLVEDDSGGSLLEETIDDIVAVLSEQVDRLKIVREKNEAKVKTFGEELEDLCREFKREVNESWDAFVEMKRHITQSSDSAKAELKREKNVEKKIANLIK